MDIDSTALIAKHLSGNTSAEDEKKLTDWIKQDPFNEELFRQVEKLWQISENVGQEIDPDLEKAWQKFKIKTEEKENIKIRSGQSRWLKIATAAALLITIVVFAKLIFFKESEKINSPQVPEKETVGSGKIELIHVRTTDSVKVFYLPDSSKIILNKNSTFSYFEKFDKERTTFLTGEAFFEVRKDSLHPFVVNSLNTRTEVFGTSFTIKDYEKDKGVKLDVISGEVKFSSIMKPGEKLLLHKGEKGMIDEKYSVFYKGISDSTDSWWEKTQARKKVKNIFIKVKQIIN